eukprot:3551437-Amphidinium_carterae.1
MATRVTTVHGHLVAIVIAVYADQAGPSTARANEERHRDFESMYAALEEYIVTAGSSPILLAGDFQTPTADQVSLARLINCAWLFDVIEQSSEAPRLPTCSGKRVIDHVLANKALMHRLPTAVQSIHRWPQDHAALDLRMKIEAPVEVLQRFMPAEALPPQASMPLECEREGWAGPLDAMSFQALLADGDVDLAYLHWSYAWERLLVARVEAQSVQLDPRAVGRGTRTGFQLPKRMVER